MITSTEPIKIKKMRETAILPQRAHESDAGYDLFADIPTEVVILPHETVKIPTGVAITPPSGTFGAIFARSGIATRQGLRPANCVGVCDSGYTGEYIVALHNDSDDVQRVTPCEKIAQLVFIPFVVGDFLVVDDLENTDRGAGGFGSNGL